jgi:hypothetical protein
MKNTILIAMFLLLAISISGLSGCAKQNEEDILLDKLLCDKDTVSFSQHIQPYINIRCMPCHDEEHHEKDVILTNWLDIQIVIASGDLMGALRHDPGYSPMPDNGPKSPDCAIAGFEKWINAGAPNN